MGLGFGYRACVKLSRDQPAIADPPSRLAETFYVLAGISAGIALTTIPMYHYGKRCRAWVSRNQKLFAL